MWVSILQIYWSTSRDSSCATLLHTGHFQLPRSQFICRYASRSKHYTNIQRGGKNQQFPQKVPYIYACMHAHTHTHTHTHTHRNVGRDPYLYMFASPSSGGNSDLLKGDGTLEGDLDTGLLHRAVHTEPVLNCTWHSIMKNDSVLHKLHCQRLRLKEGKLREPHPHDSKVLHFSSTKPCPEQEWCCARSKLTL